MSYSEQLRLFSSAIWDLNRESFEELESFVQDDSISRMRVYRKNLFFGVFDALATDFVGVRTHVGDENFRVLVRNFILQEQISSPNISEFSQEFPHFLEGAFDFHQDDLMAPLARLDLLYGYDSIQSLCVPRGVTGYWSALIRPDSDPQEHEIDFEQTEEVETLEIDGERCLRLKVRDHVSE